MTEAQNLTRTFADGKIRDMGSTEKYAFHEHQICVRSHQEPGSEKVEWFCRVDFYKEVGAFDSCEEAKKSAERFVRAYNYNHVFPRIFRHFSFEHLPEPLQDASKMFHALAKQICLQIKDSDERDVALRKLLEAKDAAVRAILPNTPV